ncbi:hypothetical protein [uncultured Oscillibacter sp.]|uniref:hypothetical protein n=1 Tax=uncultured Oscillibacter sp. TaxID=876091 RepID=UPI002602F6AF|nr:hypothetical protein [uncultured Oscillibacter sp.]
MFVTGVNCNQDTAFQEMQAQRMDRTQYKHRGKERCQMNPIILKSTKKDAKIYDEAMKKVNVTAIFLAGLSHADRLDWLKKHQFPRAGD